MNENDDLQFFEEDMYLEEVDNILLEQCLPFVDAFGDNFGENNNEHCQFEAPDTHESDEKRTCPSEEIDVTRFPQVPDEEIEELKSFAVNINTIQLTKQWMNVLNG